jgi:hypothetical protein
MPTCPWNLLPERKRYWNPKEEVGGAPVRGMDNSVASKICEREMSMAHIIKRNFSNLAVAKVVEVRDLRSKV